MVISLADVTGHAMEAAVPVVMFSGILKAQMELGGSVDELFCRLNRTLCETLDARTFVCFAMGELDPAARRLQLSTCGCPYPLHFRAASGEIVELEMDAYPLGVRPDTPYQAMEIGLEPGDRVVFCSDGVVEAGNAAWDIFGFEQTAQTVLEGCREDLSADALMARLIERAQDFAGDLPQADDMTVVVLHALA